MKVVNAEDGCVQVTTEYNTKAIKRRILAGRNEEVIKLVVAEIHQCVGIFTVAMFPDYTNYRFLCVMAADYL